MAMFALVLILVSFGGISCAFLNFPSNATHTDDPGDVLYLTPFIEDNRIQEAINASRINFSEFENIESFSGYFTVDKTYNSNLFFWFFPSESDYKNDPVILWLQGGPGSSSLIGVFHEIGPFGLKNKTTLNFREFYWSQQHSVLYIDSPVGSGFSFTNNGYAQNETKVGEDLYNALMQFFTMFPELQENEFYVTGESYAGKYIPAISYTILKNNPTASLKVNLQGLVIGNGLCDPVNMLNYGDYLYQSGLIDSNSRDIWKQYEATGIEYIHNEQYDKAFDIFHAMVYRGNENPEKSLLENDTDYNYYYNYLYPENPSKELSYMMSYINRTAVRKALHVGNTTFGDNQVETNLLDDIMRSVAPWISELLSNYRVLTYNGQLDIIIAYPLTVNFLKNLNFTAAEQYKVAPRHKWRVGQDLAGYVKYAGNLTEVLVRDAGHMVPTDQPVWMMDLITKFTRGQNLTGICC